MPCDQIRTYTYGFAKVKHPLFAAALKAAGLNIVHVEGSGKVGFSGRLPNGAWVSGTLDGTQLELAQADPNGAIANALKVAYSSHIVQLAYKRAGWAVEASKASVPGAKAFTVTKRGF